ncbi:MAG: YaeQ family protein [Gammaproteobacteria bacterium]|nr:YaeQ family protein [Gammaproteobacteria bacterium]MBU1556838.1 YaeQ family protein [Gammaproteobacteria bacterium]MBU2068846.1 YaeQ family protein [Gammaproteobacteria bacterium]MBU2184991.1 YaeQ family protein [Gammaproteobacteria bacterium]MBU2203717.1 YaeQ family protein [Gammaproteobacteria bacterium]
MQMASKVICLDLNYSCDASHAYQQQRHYVSPWQGESAEHFAKRLLAYLSLYEQHPSFAKDDSGGKTPDLYVADQYQHVQLWCQVALVPEKRLLRAAHQADKLILVLDEQETDKARHLPQPLNQHIFTLDHTQLDAFCLMLKSHMQLSVWREDPLLHITDGEHQLQLNISALPLYPH